MHCDHVGCCHIEHIAPQGTVVFDIDGLERDLQLVSFFDVVPRHDVRDPHFAASLLQVESSGCVLAGRGKWTNREGAHIAQIGCDLIGQGEAQKIHVRVRPHILKGQHRYRNSASWTRCWSRVPPQCPDKNQYGQDSHNASAAHHYVPSVADTLPCGGG